MKRMLLVLSMGALACSLSACQHASVREPLTKTTGGSDPNDQIEFWHQLAEQKLACNDDAFHGLLLFLDEKDDSADYAARVATLKSRGLLPKSFNQTAEQDVDRGTLAFAIVRAMHIKGGVVMRLTGTSERYATRELIDMGLYPPSSPNQTFSGTELVGIMGKLEDYQRGGADHVPGGLQDRKE
jgi:hypothetical protein